MKKALIIAAHPDDEVLGCGGTIARLCKEGWQIHVLIVAEGATSRSPARNLSIHQDELSDLAQSAELANKILGTTSLKLCSLPDNRMDGLELLDVVKLIETEINKHKPSLVMTHHIGDVNIDHRILHDAVIAACRPQPEFSVKTILFFEVQSSTEWRPASSGIYFAPNYYFDITKYLPQKIAALNAYQSEMRQFPHSRSTEALEYLAKWRGSTIGVAAAEAYMLGRSII